MEFSDAVTLPSPARLSLAGAFTILLVLASVMNAPADPFAELGPLGLFGVDKWVHAGSHALLTFLLAYAYLASRVRTLVVIAIVSVLLGVGVELVQSTIPWRTIELADMIANTVGTAIALVVWCVTWWQLPVEKTAKSRG